MTSSIFIYCELKQVCLIQLSYPKERAKEVKGNHITFCKSYKTGVRIHTVNVTFIFIFHVCC